VLKIKPGTINFGKVAVNQESPPHIVTLINSSRSKFVSLGAISATAGFEQVSNCTQVTPLGSCTMLVRFKPSRKGRQRGATFINDNEKNSPRKVRLVGVGN
jgi:hypothetical protein